jgi:chorismate mutase
MSRVNLIAAIARKSAKNAAMIRRAERNAKLSRMVRASLADDGAADAELWEGIESAGYADHGVDSDE